MDLNMWVLKVSHWSRAVEAGVIPVELHGYPLDIETNPAYYRPHTFNFRRPPSRQDFLDACKTLPWTSVWKDDIFPLIAANGFPIIQAGMKASSESLFKGDTLIGELAVRGNKIYDGVSYPFLRVMGSDVASVVNRMRKEKRDEARELIRQKENIICERVFAAGGSKSVVDVIKEILFEGGLRSTRT